MSSTVKLVQENTETELDLNVGLSSGDAAVGWNIEDWLVQEAEYIEGEKPPLVTETMDLLLKGSSHDDLATRKQSMHEMQSRASRYIKWRHATNPVWLHVQTCGESNERRALVHSIKLTPRSPSLDTKGWIDQNIERYRATIIREPYWEELTSGSASAATLYVGEKATLVGGGDVPARLHYAGVSASLGSPAVETVWMGIKSDSNLHGGDSENFETLWECEDGTNNSNESGVTDQVSTSASPGRFEVEGGYVKVHETDLDWDDTWQKVMEIALSDVTANYGDQYGTNLWLLRARLSSGSSTWEVRLHFGYSKMDDGDYIILDNVEEIGSTSWDIYEMGIQDVPLRDLRSFPPSFASATNESEYTIQIWAKRTSGSADLYLDCLLPIPIDEGFIKIWGGDDVGGEHTYTACGQDPQGNWYAANFIDVWGEVTKFLPYSVYNFSIPPGSGYLIQAYRSSSGSDVEDQFTVNAFFCFERWISLRGAD